MREPCSETGIVSGYGDASEMKRMRETGLECATLPSLTSRLAGQSGQGRPYSRSKDSVCDTMSLSVRYAVADFRRRRRNCCIGFFATTLLVLFAGILMLGMWKVPYILLRLGELDAGEMDMVFSGSGESGDKYVNFSDIHLKTKNSSVVRGVSPRWMFRVEAGAEETTQAPSNRLGSKDVNSSKVKGRAILLLLDGQLDRGAGIGRSWSHSDAVGDEAHVFYSLLSFLNLRPNRNDRIEIVLPSAAVYHMLYGSSPSEMARAALHGAPAMRDLLKRQDAPPFAAREKRATNSVVLTVIDAIQSSNGKYPAQFGNVIIADYQHVFSALLGKLPNAIAGPAGNEREVTSGKKPTSTGTQDSGSTKQFLERAMQVPLVLKNRREMYYRDHDERTSEMVLQSNAVMNSVGPDFNGTVRFPLVNSMKRYELVKTLLVSNLTCVTVGIVVLSWALFCVLLKTNSDERQFELAMLRTQGMRKARIMVLLLVQSLAFVIPGVIAGMGLILLFNNVIETFMARFTGDASLFSTIPFHPLFAAGAIGALLPIVAGFGPASRALSSSLREALDLYRQECNETKITVIRMEELGLSMWQTCLGIFLTVFGFIVYYVLPYSFIFENLPLFFFLLDLMLLVMMLGFCLMVYVLEPYVEALLLWLMLWGSEKRFGMIIKKNLQDHASRNSTAFMMLLISVSILFSSGVTSELLSNTFLQLTKLSNGADIVLASNSFDRPLNETELDGFLKTWRRTHVHDWSYISFPLDSYRHIKSKIMMGPAVGLKRDVTVVSATQPFFNVVFPEFIMEDSRDGRYLYQKSVDGKTDIIGSMYSSAPFPATESDGSIITGLPEWLNATSDKDKANYVVPAVTASGLGKGIDLRAGDNAVLEYKYNILGRTVNTRFLVEIRGLMNRLSGLPTISANLGRLATSEVVIPRHSFEQLLDPTTVDFPSSEGIVLPPGSVTEVRQQRLYVRLQAGINASERAAFVNELQAHADAIAHSAVNTQDILNELSTISTFIMAFFYFTTFVCLALCTLMTWITFVTNVQLNSHTFGILTSLGCTKREVARVILYEALSVVLSAIILGLVAGGATSAIMGLQITTIFDLPFEFKLPLELLGTIMALSLLSGVVGSMLPYIAVSKRPIASILKKV
ncbi:putative permease-like protein [Trypanosoma vivax]|nr:putative permease-like protein [Trypanosoma vivax]